MLVTQDALGGVLRKLSNAGTYALDTETTGLRPWQGDRLFSIIISDGETDYYFDFQETLPRTAILQLAPVLANRESLWFMHNAKFDLAMLRVEGLEVAGTVHCTMSIGRVERNDRFQYGLDALAKLIGEEKDDRVKAYIAENDLYEVIVDEEGGKVKKPRYDRVPLDLMREYGEQDARVTWKIGQAQVCKIEQLRGQSKYPEKTPYQVMLQERKLTKAFFDMETVGIKVDLRYVRNAREYDRKRMADTKKKFAELTGVEFTDSRSVLAPAFDKLGLIYPKTPKGNPSFSKEALEGLKHPVVDCLREYRDAQKRFGTYLVNYIDFADLDGAIHCQNNQGGTTHGRISVSNPNLQNVGKRADKLSPMPIRRCFVPREGFFFGMLDFDQMEYRLMVEYAMEMQLIEAIRAGLDVHTATAEMMGVDRESAKTINFMLLYGGGIAKLAAALFDTTLPHETLKALGRIYIYRMNNYREYEFHRSLVKELSEDQIRHNVGELQKAHDLLEKYFAKLPNVKKFSDGVQEVAKRRGYAVNWMGRYIYCANKQHAYAIPNHLISGGCADIVKKAMLEVDAFLAPYESRILLQIHDELLIEFHDSEEHLVDPVKKIMENAYPYRHIPMTCGADYSRKSWADKEPWNGKAA
jgi:DNA polymerase-1